MKKMILFGLLLMGSLSSYAKWITLYETHKKGDESEKSYSWYKIDRENMKWYFDSDSESEANMLIKNYKKSGNKETFDLVPENPEGIADYKRSVIIILDDKGEESEIQVTVQGYTRGWYLVTRKKGTSGKSQPASAAEASEDVKSSAVNKVKDSAKGLMNKAKGLVSKKKKD